VPEAVEFRRELVLASSNAGKLRELLAMLQPRGWIIRPQSDWAIEDAVEDGLSFLENALIKARHAARYSGMPALGDDSGLVVDALHGEPGIYSARYAGDDADDEANKQKLLQVMEGLERPHRGAHFYCAMAFVRHEHDPAPLIATGKWSGSILEQALGSGGFGYDPLFWVPDLKLSSAQLAPAVKNRISHRGQALVKLAGQMQDEFGI